jgi:DnaJ domain
VTTQQALGVAQVSFSKTQRRRFFWAVWWSGAPAIKPFRKPDASNGGARTLEEATREADQAAQRPLMTIEPKWAKAWMRVLRGEPTWPDEEKARSGGSGPTAKTDDGQRGSVWAVLGIDSNATLDEIKRAYRKRALSTHPDHGGDGERFRAVQRAYEKALEKRVKPARKRVSRPQSR